MEVANASIAPITSPLQSVKAGKEVDKDVSVAIPLSLKLNNELQKGTKKMLHLSHMYHTHILMQWDVYHYTPFLIWRRRGR